MFDAAPNTEAARTASLTEEELLIAEMAYSPAFRRFLEYIVAPRVTEVRAELLRNPNLPEAARSGMVMFLLELEKMIHRVYEPTEAEEPPAWVLALFR